MVLSDSQRLGAAIISAIILVIWVALAMWPSRQKSMPEPTEPQPKRTWEQRKDSMRRADSIRYAQWAAEREQRYDSFRLADSARRATWNAERQQRWDSARLADSLWRDSVGLTYSKRIKKDTILDLNRCDTTELQFIRGIGPYTATQIVRYRTQLGGFYSPAQLTDEPLVNLHLDTLLHHFTADTTYVQQIDVNSCNISILQRHPYLRYEQARAIYSLRRKNVRLHSLDELSSLPELSADDLRRIAPYISFK